MGEINGPKLPKGMLYPSSMGWKNLVKRRFTYRMDQYRKNYQKKSVPLIMALWFFDGGKTRFLRGKTNCCLPQNGGRFKS